MERLVPPAVDTTTPADVEAAAVRWSRGSLLQELKAYRRFGAEKASSEGALHAARFIFAFDFGTGAVNPLLARSLVPYWLQDSSRTVVTQPNIERAIRELLPPGSRMAGPLHLVFAEQDTKWMERGAGAAVPYTVCEHLLLPRPQPLRRALRLKEKQRYIDTHDVVDAVREEVPRSRLPAIVIAQCDHLWRAARTVAKAGFIPVITPDVIDVYDSHDGQAQVQSRSRFRRREVGARLYYRWRGWI